MSLSTLQRAWIDGDRIVTRNSDGGTTGWDLAEAVRLSRRLDHLIARLEANPPMNAAAPAPPTTVN